MYVYVNANPNGRTDPLGLFTVVGGGGGSLVLGVGGEGSGGAYVNPGLFGQPADFGVFGSGGIGAGSNVGVNSYLGVVFGSASNVNTPFVNTNVSLGIGSLTLMFDPNTGKLGGFSIGPAAEAGASVIYTDTGKFSIREFFSSKRPARSTCR
jgi:hypothetical protein